MARRGRWDGGASNCNPPPDIHTSRIIGGRSVKRERKQDGDKKWDGFCSTSVPQWQKQNGR